MNTECIHIYDMQNTYACIFKWSVICSLAGVDISRAMSMNELGVQCTEAQLSCQAGVSYFTSSADSFCLRSRLETLQDMHGCHVQQLIVKRD